MDTPAFLTDPSTLDQFVLDWEQGRLPKPAWTHAAHVGVAACYGLDRSADELFAVMKAGIRRFNEAVGTVNGPTSGYHETLTRFWSETIARFLRERQPRPATRFEAVRAAVDAFGQARDLHTRFYSFDVVRDLRARQEWIAPDRTPAHSSEASEPISAR